MRFAREIIDTLKIELGFLKFRSVELNVDNKISSSEVIMDTFFDGFGQFDCSIQGFNLSSEVIVNLLRLDNLSLAVDDLACCYINPVSIVDETPVSFEYSDLVREKHFDEEFNVNFLELETITDEMIEVAIIKDVEMLKAISRTFAISIDKSSTKIITFKGLNIKRAVINDQSVPSFVFSSVFLPSKYVQKEKLYEVLRRLRTQYDINVIKFFGYYERIPLEMVKKMKVLSNHSLMTEFDMNKKMSNRYVLKDIIVFRYDDKYIYQVV
ncbi:MAG: hypothetical protein WBH60_05965 [Fervidobacterium sp.]